MNPLNEKYYYELLRRKHRTMAHYLSHLAWVHSVDCIVISADELKALLGLERLLDSRDKYLVNDIRPWFPFQKEFCENRGRDEGPLATVFLSRREMRPHIPEGWMSDEDRIAAMMKDGGPRAVTFRSIRHKATTETEIASELALFMTGLETLRDGDSTKWLRIG